MQEVIQEYLSGIHFQGIQTHKNLEVLGFSFQKNNDYSCLLLDEAIAAEAIEITEHETPVVESVCCWNKCNSHILIFAEILKNCKQDRTIQKTYLIAPQSITSLKVNCIEQGRWHSKSKSFSSDKDRMLSARLRSRKSRNMQQGELWREVSESLSSRGIESDTSSLSASYDFDAPMVSEYLSHFSCSEMSTGACFFINGQLIALECFTASVYPRIFPKLLSSYILDACESYRDVKYDAASLTATAMSFIKTIIESKIEKQPSDCLGEEYKLNTPDVSLSGLAHNGILFHLAAFNDGMKVSQVCEMARASLRRRQLH